MHPTNPATAKGCISTTASSGRAGKSVFLPRVNSTRPPTKLLVRSIWTGTTGISPCELARIASIPDTVVSKPTIRNKIETSNPASGPAMPKSKSDFKFGGGDLRGVMVPVNPRLIEGMMFGRPMSNCCKQKITSQKF